MIEVRIKERLILWTDEVVSTLDAYRQRRRRDREAGGILLGEVSAEAVLVNRLSVPSEHDRRSRFGFLRSRAPAQAVVNHEHLDSGGRITYLGEWHTHPATVAIPSRQDEQMIRSQWTDNEIPAGLILMVILGTEVDHVGVFDGVELVGTTVSLASPRP